jgi:hypothetical protein
MNWELIAKMAANAEEEQAEAGGVRRIIQYEVKLDMDDQLTQGCNLAGGHFLCISTAPQRPAQGTVPFELQPTSGLTEVAQGLGRLRIRIRNFFPPSAQMFVDKAVFFLLSFLFPFIIPSSYFHPLFIGQYRYLCIPFYTFMYTREEL